MLIDFNSLYTYLYIVLCVKFVQYFKYSLLAYIPHFDMVFSVVNSKSYSEYQIK